MAKPIKHVMLDTETLAIKPNAAVIQAGIVHRLDSGLLHHAQHNCSPVLYREHMDKFTVEQNTINFHYRENPENLQLCTKSPLTIVQFAESIRQEIEDAKEGGKFAIWLWCCGTDFDIPIIANLFSFAGIKPNWSYSNVRDYRTLRDLHKVSVPKNYKNDHCAVRDAANQYMHLMEILTYMGHDTLE